MGVVGQDSVQPGAFAWKLKVMLGLVIADCICNGFGDHIWGPGYKMLNVALCITPILLHVLMLLLFFMLLWHTFLLRYGLLFEVWSEFRGVFLLSLLRFVALLGSRIPRLIGVLSGASPADYWQSPVRHAMFFAHNLVSVLHHTMLLRRSYALARVRFYKPALWQKRRKAAARSVMSA